MTRMEMATFDFTGFTVSLSMVLFGMSWPGYLTPIALLAIPSPIMFLVSVVYPGKIRKNKYISLYLLSCVILSDVVILREIARVFQN